MSYDVHVTEACLRDIASASDYIDFVLLNHEAAIKLEDDVEAAVNLLSDAPKSYALVADPLLASWGIRFTLVGNYSVFFLVDDDAQIVYALRFLHEKQNWNRILRGEPDHDR